MQKHVDRLLNKTSLKFILGFTFVVFVVLAVTVLLGRYAAEDVAGTESCPRGEEC